MQNQLLPKNMQFIDHGSYVEIIRTWRGIKTLLVAAFTVFWWAFLYKFFEKLDVFDASWIYLVPMIHVVVGFFLIHFVLASFFNKTHIYADKSKIEIRHRPIRWWGNKVIDSTDLAQLYTKQIVRYNQRGGRSTSYQLRAKTHSRRDIKLLSGLSNADQAIFVEEKLETLLKIKNERVRGEY